MAVRLRQDNETPLTKLTVSFGMVRYLYARSGDSVEAGSSGQDYVAFRYGDTRLTFAVCDGVGQSFMGELAARLLGDGLVAWLWTAQYPSNAAVFAAQVTEALNALTVEGTRQVRAFELPPNLPSLIVQALENQRAYGSESMFVAGRLELGEPQPWLALSWLGDSPVAAIDIDGHLVDLGPPGHTSERWNALTGVKGQVHTWVGNAENVSRVVGYSDGLGLSHPPTDDDLVYLTDRWRIAPPSDDASLFDVRLVPQPEPGHATVAEDETALTDVGAPLQPDLVRTLDSLESWQQAALVGLTSLALTLLMIKRLVDQSHVQSDT